MKPIVLSCFIFCINALGSTPNPEPKNVQVAVSAEIQSKTGTYVEVKATTADLDADASFKFALEVLNITAGLSTQERITQVKEFLKIGLDSVPNQCLLFADVRFILLPKYAKDYVVTNCSNFYNWGGLNQHFNNHVLGYFYIHSAEFQKAVDAAYDAYVQSVYNDIENGGEQLSTDIKALYGTYYNKSLFNYYNIHCTRTAPKVLPGATTKPVATLLDQGDVEFLDELSPSFKALWDAIQVAMKEAVARKPEFQFGKSFYNSSMLYKFGAQQPAPGVQFFAVDDAISDSAVFNPLNTQDNLLNIQNYCLPYGLSLKGSWDFGTAIIKYCFAGNQPIAC